MGYHVKAVSSVAKAPEKRASTRTWKLQFIKQENGVRSIRDIPLEEYRVHGFLPSMTIDQAKAQKRMANERLTREEHEVKKIKIAQKLTERERAHFLYLPEADVRAFEDQVLFRRIARGSAANAKRNKLTSHWNAVKDMICALKIDPSDWEAEAHRFYNYMADKGCSLSYVKKMTRILNAWGNFSARKGGKYFARLPYPRGMDRAHIANAHHEKRKRYRLEGKFVASASLPLSPELLKAKKKHFKPSQYRWLRATVWFGLRPDEMEKILSDPESVRVEYDSKLNAPVLWVFQHKLVALKHEDRWKAIPCLYAGQRNAVRDIERKACKKPLLKTIKRYIGEGYTRYAGRKGFEDLMTGKGHSFEVVSEWLGHQSIEQTWRNYRKKRRVRV